jgi:hypothetical protein
MRLLALQDLITVAHPPRSFKEIGVGAKHYTSAVEV